MGERNYFNPVSSVPKTDDLATASDVYIIRESNFVGSGLTYTVGLDHQDFLKIGSGQYVQIKADRGPHILSVKYPKQAFVGTVEKSMDFVCQPDKKVYLLMWPGFSVKMKELSVEEGAKLVSKYKRIDLK